MIIEAKDFELKMTYNELWTIACALKTNLENNLRTHWVNHQNSWQENEKENRFMIERMFNALGRSDMYQDITKNAESIFAEFNKKRKS